MIKNTENHYGIIAKLFHWLIAVAIISLITVGFIMSDMSPSPDKYEWRIKASNATYKDL